MSRAKDPKKEMRGLDKELKSYKGTLRDASFLFEDKVLELSLLRRVGDIVGYILDLESFYRMFLDILLEETNAENCSIMIMDTETNRLALKMARGKNDEGTFFNHPVDSEVTFSLGEGVAGKVALERKTILIDDVSIDKCFKIKETRFPIGSLLCTPLIFQEKVFGIINLSHTQTHAFNQNTKRIIELLCIFVSSIIGDAIDYIKMKDQEKFKSMFEGVRLPILLVEPKTNKIVGCNGYAEEWLGYSKKELIHTDHVFDVVPHEYREKVECIVNEIVEKNSSKFDEVSFIRKDGSVNIGEINGTMIDYQGKNIVQVTVKDITERKKVEMELVRIRAAVNNASDGIAIADAEGKIFYQNQTFLDLFGYTAEEISKMEIPSLYENSEMISEVVEIMSKGERWSGEVKILSKDGKTTSCLLGANPILDDKKNVIGYLGIHTDITNLKMAEEALIESKERYQDLIEFANVGIIVTDDGKITKVNRIAENIYGYSKDELTGKPASILTLEKYRKQHVEMLHEMVGSGEAKRAIFEEEGVKKDGTLFPVEISFSLVEPRVNTIIAVMRDTTERKEMEQKLLQSEKLKSLGELSGGVAHDFNNVLAAILGRAQLLKMIVDSPPSKKERRQSVLELKKGLEVIEKASLDGAETVRRIQEFARRRDDDKYFTLVDMTRVIDNALDFTKLRWKNDAESKGIKIKIKKKLALLPSLPGSESELREVIVNIINNAIDAMPQGGDITIKTFKKDNQACIKVTDTGIGIPQTIGNRIFDPFFTTKGPQSSGLGMSVSYGIIHRHRGTIMIDGVEGKGSTVTIEIPFSEKIVEERKAKPLSSGQKKAKILIIEDEEDVCNLLKDILTYEGHEVETASNGKSGIEEFKKKVFDMVLTDLGMPGMSGWQVAEKIKSINGNVPIALITGWRIDLKESEIKERGIDFVIKKPYKLDQLVNIVQEGMLLKERFKTA